MTGPTENQAEFWPAGRTSVHAVSTIASMKKLFNQESFIELEIHFGNPLYHSWITTDQFSPRQFVTAQNLGRKIDSGLAGKIPVENSRGSGSYVF
jgi:hypothetical protein